MIDEASILLNHETTNHQTPDNEAKPMNKWFLSILLSVVCVPSWSHTGHAATKTIVVNSVTELIKAIGPNRTIKINPGTYQLTPQTSHRLRQAHGMRASGQRGLTTKYVSWEQSNDGPEMHIRNVSNLEIVGIGKPRLLARPRYAWVMKFSHASRVTLSGLVLGHTPHGGCTGGVVSFDQSKEILIENSDLFGSGTIGIGLNRVQKFKMVNSTVHDCTYGIMRVANSSDVSFLRSSFIKNREFDLVEIKQTKQVRFYKCIFRDNRVNASNAFFSIDASSSVLLEQTTWKSNQCKKLTDRPKKLKITGASEELRQALHRIPPEFNQVYRLLRYRHWIAAGTQGGIVLWNTHTGKPEHIQKAFIANHLLVDAGHLWAGTYRSVMRFDGKQWQVMLRTRSRGISLLKSPSGDLLARAGRRVWRYGKIHEVWRPISPPKAAGLRGHDVLIRSNGASWSIQFLRGITRRQGANVTQFALRSSQYPGSDPRRFYQGADGSFWVIDFGGGFYRWDPKVGRFAHLPSGIKKGSAMAIDVNQQRTWLLSYTRGIRLYTSAKQAQFFNLRKLQYMRDMFLDKNGDVWIGGWNQIIRLYQEDGQWKQRAYIAR